MRHFQRKGGIYRRKRSPMESKAAFISFWKRNCQDAPLPDLDFFDSVEGLQDRVDLCKQNLKDALFTLEKEGLIFRFLSKLQNSNDYDDFKGEVCGVLRRVFSDTLGFTSDGSDIEPSSNELESTANRTTDRNSISDVVTDEPFLIRGSSFAFTIDSDKQQQNRTANVDDESESGPSLRGGSELQAVDEEVHLPGLAFPHSTTETSADRDVELLNTPNDKVFLSKEILPCDEGRRVSTNEYGAVGNASNQKVLITTRDSQQMDRIEGKATGSNTKETVQDVGDLPVNVRGPFKSGTLPSNRERSCKWQTEGRPFSDGSCQAPDFTISYETKSNESHKSEGGIEPSDIDEKTRESLETRDKSDTMNNQNNTIKPKQNEEDGMSNSSEERPTLAEEEAFFVDLSEEKEGLDVASLDQETVVVDDLISYLEGIEFENSSEEGEDSAASEGSGQMSYRFQGQKEAIYRAKQLQSVLSTTSGISGDSCLSPYAVDVAMSEIHSAESSDQEEVIIGSNEPSPVGENTPTVVLPMVGDAPAKPTPPVKPPRRRSKRGMVRAHTVGTPQEIKAKARGYSEEDEVFCKEEEGYDGDQENQALSQSHSNISTTKDASVQFRLLLATGEEERRKLRRSRGSNVILDEDNIDFPSSPLSSPVSSSKLTDPKELKEDDAHKLQNRKWVASALVDSEKTYLECLNMLCKHMKPIKASLATTVPILSTTEFNKIFFKIDELFKIHEKFYHDLELRVSNWNIRQIIGDLFLSLVYQFDVYREYMQNYKTAMNTINKCKSNEQFSQIFSMEIKLACVEERVSLESLFSKPVDRIGRYVTSISDLIKQTPKDHPDHGILLEVQVVTQDFLVKVSGVDQKDGAHFPRVKRDHRMIKDGFLVELSDGIRKFRHLFLFNDVLLCAKRKVTARHEQYVCKWYLPLSDVLFHPHDNSEASQMVPVASEPDLDLLKGRIVSLKSEIRKEQGTTGQGSSPDDSPSTKRKRAQSTNKTIEKLRKKLAQQEAALLLLTPSLPFHLYNKQSTKTYTLLCKSDVERANWKEGMLSQIKEGSENPSGFHLSVFELQSLLEACKKLRTCKTIGKVSIVEDKELLNGLLYVDIQNGKGFHRNDLYCVLEVDHYGQFVRKAKTKICKATGDPVWNQDFDIEVEGSKELRLHVFGKSRYGLMSDEECGLGKITLTRENLTDQKKRNITISLDKQGAVTLSIQYSKTLQGIQRKKSVSESGVFGVDIAMVTSREEFDIPLIVIGCVREVEKRGIDEVGIYRLSGASSDVRRLKDAFNENSQSALVSISETDIHAVSGLLKLYLRELPEPLFTDYLYNDFVETYGIADKEEKKERMLELLNSLPTPNKLTALYLYDHLRRIGDNSDVNKMSLNNLATIFGPNVSRPSPKTSSPMDLAQGTLDVMSQVGIFLYFLKLDSDDVRLPNNPELKSRLYPTHSVDSVDFNDRLI